MFLKASIIDGQQLCNNFEEFQERFISETKKLNLRIEKPFGIEFFLQLR